LSKPKGITLYERIEKEEEPFYLSYAEIMRIYNISILLYLKITQAVENADKIKRKEVATKCYHKSLFENCTLRKSPNKDLIEIKNNLAKDIKQVCGIYCIKYNNEIVYIGVSKNVRKRVLNHFTTLFTKTHTNKSLEEFFYNNKIELFSTEIIEECTIKERFIKEKVYIKKLKPRFNIKESDLDTHSLNKLKATNLKTIHFKNTISTDVDFKSIIEDKDKLIAELQEKLLEFNSKSN